MWHKNQMANDANEDKSELNHINTHMNALTY